MSHHPASTLRLLILAAALWLGAALPAAADPAADVHARLLRWADDFNAGRADNVCDLFSMDLISDYRGQGPADHAARCRQLRRALADPARSFHYAPVIKDILVSGDVVIVRLDWTLTVTPGDIKAVEAGLDVFRKETDGAWRIIRMMAYDEDAPPP